VIFTSVLERRYRHAFLWLQSWEVHRLNNSEVRQALKNVIWVYIIGFETSLNYR
jgi:very-short-patch-repair endonuclease